MRVGVKETGKDKVPQEKAASATEEWSTMSYKNMSLLGPPLLDLEQREHAVKEDMEPSNLFLTAAGFAFSDERRAFTHRQGEQMAATPASF